jgi:hypothetical protein
MSELSEKLSVNGKIALNYHLNKWIVRLIDNVVLFSPERMFNLKKLVQLELFLLLFLWHVERCFNLNCNYCFVFRDTMIRKTITKSIMRRKDIRRSTMMKVC